MKASEMKAKFPIEDEIWRGLEVPSPVQTLLFFLFRSMAFSEYKRIFVGLFLHCEFVFKEYWALKPDENLQEVGLHGCVFECPGKVQGEEATG